MITLRTHFECEIAHRLFNVDTYSEECRDNIHGHSYKFDIEVARKKHDNEELNNAGMIVDFKLLKETLKEFEHKYDHSVIIRDTDPLMQPLLDNCKKVNVCYQNPTAEWMVLTFSKELNDLFDKYNLEIETVELHIAETTGNIAIWRKL